MTRDAIYTFVTSLLFGYPMDVTFFYTLLDQAQQEREASRPWVILRSEDASQTITTSNTFTTSKALPTGFLKWYGNSPIVIVDANNYPTPLREVPISEKYNYKDTFGVFYVDYATSLVYICGTITQTYTLHQYFIKKSTLVSAAQANTWVFGTSFDKILGYDIALAWKGIDYDIINNQNAAILRGKADKIEDQMTKWDSDLQNSMTRGIDPYGSGGMGWQAGYLPSEYNL